MKFWSVSKKIEAFLHIIFVVAYYIPVILEAVQMSLQRLDYWCSSLHLIWWYKTTWPLIAFAQLGHHCNIKWRVSNFGWLLCLVASIYNAVPVDRLLAATPSVLNYKSFDFFLHQVELLVLFRKICANIVKLKSFLKNLYL